MRPVEIQVKINVARREMEYWQAILADKKCGTCTEWGHGVCQKYNAAPPAGEKEPGCDDWCWDCIPF